MPNDSSRLVGFRSCHEAFALTIASDIPLIELPPGNRERNPDVEVSIGCVPDAPPPSAGWTVCATPDDVSGWMPGGGAFHVRDGRRIVIAPLDGADDRALRLAVVGPLLGVVLMQRGLFVLHASTVAIAGRAVAFFGPSGRGKSTLSAAFARAGHPLIADDMTVIETSGGSPLVRPGFPRVKLWPAAAGALGHDVGALPRIHPAQAKRSVQFARALRTNPLPLARCYLVEDGDEESSLVMPVREAVFALVGSTYQGWWLRQTGAAGPNLRHCGELTRSGVVRRLRRRRAFEALHSVIRFVEEDLRR